MAVRNALKALPAVLTGVILISPLTPASAAGIPAAITSASIRETTIGQYQVAHLDFTWRVPDGTRAGDTFYMKLSDRFTAAAGLRFPLLTPDRSATVANAVVSGDGRTVTFTMTGYAATRTQVTGRGWIEVTATRAATINASNPVRITVGTKTYTDAVTVTGVTGDASGAASKYQTLSAGRIRFGIAAPRPTYTGQTLTITDTPRNGQQIDCGSIEVFGWESLQKDGTASGFHYIADARHGTTGTTTAGKRWTKTCTPTKLVLTVETSLDQATNNTPWVVQVVGNTSLGTPSATKWVNTGSVAFGAASIPVSHTLVNPKAWGTGVGTNTTTTPMWLQVDTGTWRTRKVGQTYAAAATDRQLKPGELRALWRNKDFTERVRFIKVRVPHAKGVKPTTTQIAAAATAVLKTQLRTTPPAPQTVPVTGTRTYVWQLMAGDPAHPMGARYDTPQRFIGVNASGARLAS